MSIDRHGLHLRTDDDPYPPDCDDDFSVVAEAYGDREAAAYSARLARSRRRNTDREEG